MISMVGDPQNELDAAPPARSGRALIFGSGSPTLNAATAVALASWGVEVVVAAPAGAVAPMPALDADAPGSIHPEPLAWSDDATQLIDDAARRLGGLDVVVNLHAPSPHANPAEVLDYPRQLLERSLAAAETLVASSKRASIVSQCFLPAFYAGTPLEDVMPAVKGALTGLTRTLCRRYAHLGLRANYVQTGLIDLPELKPGLSEMVRSMTTPLGRWGTAEDVADLIAFLALEDHYMTGQVVLLDGGLTAGLTGT